MKMVQFLRWHRVAALLLFTVLVIAIWSNRPLFSQAAGSNPEAYLPLIQVPEIWAPSHIQIVPHVTGIQDSSVTVITHAGDERLFVAEKRGRIRVFNENGTMLSQPFLNISQEVGITNWEEGFLGLVFHPDYPTTPYFYISYTQENHQIRIARGRVSDSNPNRADADSLETLFVVDKFESSGGDVSPVHNGGDMHFGPDGYLYIAFGDGGPDPVDPSKEGDPANNGQSKTLLLGNMVRINVIPVGEPGAGLAPDCGATQNYSIPDDNPYVDRAGCDEIWATGFRNPWRFSFDRLTGDLYIGDVGEWEREEVNFQSANSNGGENYGWHCYEGTYDYTQKKPQYSRHCDEVSEFVMPFYEYESGGAELGCSAVGGYVYRGTLQPHLYGSYLFGDFCAGRMWVMINGETGWEVFHMLPDNNHHISTFGEDVHGELYIGTWTPSGNADTIYRVVVD